MAVVLRTIAGRSDANTVTVNIKTDDADTVVICVSSYDVNPVVAADISDTAGNTGHWNSRTLSSGGIVREQIFDISSWDASPLVGSSNDAITVNHTGAFCTVAVYALKTNFGSAPFNVQGGGTGTGVTSLALSGNITPTQSTVIIAACGGGTHPFSGSETYTGVTAGFNIEQNISGIASTAFALCTASLQTSSAVNPTFSWTGGASDAAVRAVAYKIVTGGLFRPASNLVGLGGFGPSSFSNPLT